MNDKSILQQEVRKEDDGNDKGGNNDNEVNDHNEM